MECRCRRPRPLPGNDANHPRPGLPAGLFHPGLCGGRPLCRAGRIPAQHPAGALLGRKGKGASRLYLRIFFALLRSRLEPHLLERDASPPPVDALGQFRGLLPGPENAENPYPYPRDADVQPLPFAQRRRAGHGGVFRDGGDLPDGDIGPGRKRYPTQEGPGRRPDHGGGLAGRRHLLPGHHGRGLWGVPGTGRGRLEHRTGAQPPENGEPGRRRKLSGMGFGPHGRERAIPLLPGGRKAPATYQHTLRRHGLHL